MITTWRRVRAALPLFLAACPTLAWSAPADYLDELVAAARELELAETRQWHALVHYRPNLFRRGVTGQADDPGFYLAANGKTDPAAELEATLRAFFDPPVVEGPERQHPQCRFIARYDWLRETLDFDPARLPPQTCRRYEEWRAALDAAELTLVFPSAFINNPSSMFGHTLLRVDGAGQDERTRLLAYAINYAVNPSEDGEVLFILKSLTGFYPGLFSISPYYVKVRSYSDLENRDIWEYRLNLTAGEIDRLLMHAWELSFTHFDYYFFDENCAYHLLSLFEVARPGLDLTRRFRGYAIPLDTVRLLTREPGLLREAVYRPASNTRLRHRLAGLDRAELALVRRLVEGEAADDVLPATLDPARRALLLETAFGLVRRDANSGRRDAVAAARVSRDLLVARSAFPPLPEPVEPPVPSIRPDQGHATRRAALGAGREAGRDFVTVALRPAYNDLLDPTGGYTEGAQINFLDLAFRHEDGGSLRLEQLAILDILSLAPRDEFFRPVSWRLDAGIARKRIGDDRPLVWRTGAGAGLAWGKWESVVGYVMVEGALDVSGHLEDGYAAGVGPRAGAFMRPHPAWKIHAYGRVVDYMLGDEHGEREYALEQSLSFSRDHALRLTIAERRDADASWAYASAAWHWYF